MTLLSGVFDMANKLIPGCGCEGIERSMWHSGTHCILEACDREKCCFPVTPGVTEVCANSFVTLDDDLNIIAITPDNVDSVDKCDVWFAPCDMFPKDYCKEREVWCNFVIKCDCVCWPEDATEEFKAQVWKLARYKKILCRENEY